MSAIKEAQKAVREWDEGKHCHWDSRAYVDVIRELLSVVAARGLSSVVAPSTPDTFNGGEFKFNIVIDPSRVQDVYVADKVIYVRQNDKLYYLENKKLHPVM